MTISSVSASPTPCACEPRARRAAGSDFAAALAATEDAGAPAPAAAGSNTATSSPATPSTATSPDAVVRCRDGTVAYEIDPATVRRLAPPTREGVQTLTTDLAAELDTAFAEAGLATDPPVMFTIDESGAVHATGERDDLAAIEALVAGDEELRRSIRIAHSIAAQAHALENAEPEDSYRTASDPRIAVERFARMMEAQKATTMAFVYGGGSVSVTADGTAWLAAAAPDVGS